MQEEKGENFKCREYDDISQLKWAVALPSVVSIHKELSVSMFEWLFFL